MTVWKNCNVSEQILEEDGKGETNTIIMGEWNSEVGDKSYKNIVRPHVLQRRNQTGQMHINQNERNGLGLTNTWFKKSKRRLDTWCSYCLAQLYISAC
jgi:hypothetical protein